jgi:hypothetical protein
MTRLVADFCEEHFNARWPFVLAGLLTLVLVVAL